jgi:hypothetical protein
MTKCLNRWTLLLPFAALAITGGLWTEGRADAGRSLPVAVDYYFPSVGIVDGEALRVSIANLEDVPPGPCRITLLDSQGAIVADSGDLDIPGRGTASFSIGWSRLAIQPERGTGRKQFRARVNLMNSAGLPADPIRPGVELVNTATGHTFGIAPPPDPDFASIGM